MLDVIKPLLDSDLINEETRSEIQEAWTSKLEETKDQVRAELREEFAQRYEHDKSNMVEAIDRMVTEGLTTELNEVKAEKAQLAEDRVKFNASMKENANKFNNFMVGKLAEEIKDLRQDRKAQTSTVGKLEEFVVKALSEEIKEFAQDKQDVVETKVKLVAEARAKLEELKTKFVTESSEKMTNAVAKHLKAELSQLQEDIKVARENSFGRKIFETFAGEFMGSYLNEGTEVAKMNKEVSELKAKLDEATKIVADKEVQIVESTRKSRIATDNAERKLIMNEMMNPLSKQHKDIMNALLESTKTADLQNAFNKYLPSVLNEETKTITKTKKVLSESSKEITGGKTTVAEANVDANIVNLRKLAGIQ